MKIVFALLLLIPLAGCASVGQFTGGVVSALVRPHYYPVYEPVYYRPRPYYYTKYRKRR